MISNKKWNCPKQNLKLSLCTFVVGCKKAFLWKLENGDNWNWNPEKQKKLVDAKEVIIEGRKKILPMILENNSQTVNKVILHHALLCFTPPKMHSPFSVICCVTVTLNSDLLSDPPCNAYTWSTKLKKIVNAAHRIF